MMARRFALLGRKLSHSLSAQIHACFGDYSYELAEREPAQLDAFFADTSYDGFNVTIPYKITAFERCDLLSDTAKKTGAVNTVLRRSDGLLFGDNTDYFGFSYLAKRSGVSFFEKKVVVLGSGGASRTVQAVALDAGARSITLISRSGKENYENLFRHSDADVIVNATPVGMFPNNLVSPVDLTLFQNRPAVLDLIYHPRNTALLMQAQELGLKTGGGMPMLVAQAKRAAELFLQTELSDALIEPVIKQMLFSQCNIILIGMPGCGKSTVASLLAKRMNRAVFDTDREVEAYFGQSVAVIFTERGETAFRDAESVACETLGKRLGAVIATGGGTVLRERNRTALRQNGVIVYLRRELSALSKDGRPLSTNDAALQEIYRQRKEIYEQFADFTVDVDNDAAVTAERVIACISSCSTDRI